MGHVLQLRNHIPIASPARREPVDGAEPPLRVSLGFEPQWFHVRCGADFSERWHYDPQYRGESRQRMKAELEGAFPEAGCWRGVTDADLASLSGCWGITVVPRIFGVPARYHKDRWPEIEPGHALSDDDIGRLDADRLLAGPAVEEIFRQMDAIESGWGPVRGYLNWQGVLNIAFHLRGRQIFLDMGERPELAERLFAVIAEVLIRLAHQVQERQRWSGFAIDQLDVSNCTLSLISPPMYRRFLAPHDAAIARSFERFGVHTCNWDVTPYLGELGALPKVGYLDMGLRSDLKRAKAAVPGARHAVILGPRLLVDSTPEQLESELERVARELAPCDVVAPDLPPETPDERVRELIRWCAPVTTRPGS